MKGIPGQKDCTQPCLDGEGVPSDRGMIPQVRIPIYLFEFNFQAIGLGVILSNHLRDRIVRRMKPVKVGFIKKHSLVNLLGVETMLVNHQALLLQA